MSSLDSFPYCFSYNLYGTRGREDPEVSGVIFSSFFFTNGKEKEARTILSYRESFSYCFSCINDINCKGQGPSKRNVSDRKLILRIYGQRMLLLIVYKETQSNNDLEGPEIVPGLYPELAGVVSLSFSL